MKNDERIMKAWVVRAVSGVSQIIFARSEADAVASFKGLFPHLKREPLVVNRARNL